MCPSNDGIDDTEHFLLLCSSSGIQRTDLLAGMYSLVRPWHLAFGCGIFLDSQTAFDTVNHQSLLKKLEHYGIKGTALYWFCFYLSNREQHVSANGDNSCNQRVICGVLQGSVLAPLIFLIYNNDISKASYKLSFYLLPMTPTLIMSLETWSSFKRL